jgi:maleylacetoacetate isomerase
MPKHDFVLHHYWRSSCSWRLRWALALKGISYRSVPVNLLKGEQRSPDYLKINPAGTVPCMQIDGVPFTQSLAIMEWLDEQYPKRPLLPVSPIDRLKTRELSLVIAADTQPLQNMGPQQYFSSDANKRAEYARHWIEKGLRTFETLVRPLAGTFSMGDSITIADICLIPQCYNAQRFNLNLSPFPTVQRIYRNALLTSECESAAPHNQPGAEPNSKPRVD